MRRICKGLVIWILVVTMLLIDITPIGAATISGNTVNPTEVEENIIGAGDEPDALEVRLVDVLEDTSAQSDLSPTYVYEVDAEVYEIPVVSVYATETSRSVYSCDYVYQRMTDEEKQLYDMLDFVCEAVRNDMLQPQSIDYDGECYHYTGLYDISSLGLSYERAYYVAMMFRYSNGQFFFVDPTIWRRSGEGANGNTICHSIGLGIYDVYADSTVRNAAISEFDEKIAEYQQVAATETTAQGKVKAIHDKMAREIDYIANDYDQSAAGALLMGKCVCAGYTAAYSAICNSIGIDTVSVTSDTHGWNRSLINGKWYNVDVTWGDQGNTIIYNYLNKSDNYYANYSTYCAESHKQLAWWNGYVPSCNYDLSLDGVITYNPNANLNGWVMCDDGKERFYRNGNVVKNEFVFDGTYTYFAQADGTAMKDRLTYHPDGVHIIYLDEYGHEVFNAFQYCPSVGYTCYFDSRGYIYKDKITFYRNNAYYLDENGRMKKGEWFTFANGRDVGYAEANGALRTYGFGYDPWGRVVFYHWNGMVARGLISDGVTYYLMDQRDGHLVGMF